MRCQESRPTPNLPTGCTPRKAGCLRAIYGSSSLRGGTDPPIARAFDLLFGAEPIIDCMAISATAFFVELVGSTPDRVLLRGFNQLPFLDRFRGHVHVLILGFLDSELNRADTRPPSARRNWPGDKRTRCDATWTLVHFHQSVSTPSGKTARVKTIGKLKTGG